MYTVSYEMKAPMSLSNTTLLFRQINRLLEQLLSLVKKSNCKKYSNNPDVMKARNLVVKFQRSYKTKKLSVRRKHLQVAKQRLNEEYNHLEREYECSA